MNTPSIDSVSGKDDRMPVQQKTWLQCQRGDFAVKTEFLLELYIIDFDTAPSIS